MNEKNFLPARSLFRLIAEKREIFLHVQPFWVWDGDVNGEIWCTSDEQQSNQEVESRVKESSRGGGWMEVEKLASSQTQAQQQWRSSTDQSCFASVHHSFVVHRTHHTARMNDLIIDKKLNIFRPVQLSHNHQFTIQPSMKHGNSWNFCMKNGIIRDTPWSLSSKQSQNKMKRTAKKDEEKKDYET